MQRENIFENKTPTNLLLSRLRVPALFMLISRPLGPKPLGLIALFLSLCKINKLCSLSLTSPVIHHLQKASKSNPTSMMSISIHTCPARQMASRSFFIKRARHFQRPGVSPCALSTQWPVGGGKLIVNMLGIDRFMQDHVCHV